MDIGLKGTMDGICAAKEIQSQMNVPVIEVSFLKAKTYLQIHLRLNLENHILTNYPT